MPNIAGAMKKICPKCKTTLSVDNFSRNCRRKDGLCSQCKSCVKKYHKVHYAANRARILEKCHVYYAKNSARASERQKAYRESWSTSKRERHLAEQRSYCLQRRNNMTTGQYQQMLIEQSGCCAICGCGQQADKRLGVDHDHVTDEIRGLLCDNCNTLLGKAKDSPILLAKAIEYLTKRRETRPVMKVAE